MRFKRRFVRQKRRAFRRPMARVRRTWHNSLLLSTCDVISLNLSGCVDDEGQVSPDSENDFVIGLLSKEDLEDSFSDRCTVKRIVGDLFWQPGADDPADCAIAQILYQGIGTYEWFAGLRKTIGSKALPAGPQLSPLVEGEDFSEGQWLKTWHRYVEPDTRIGDNQFDVSQMQFPVVVHNVHTDGPPENIFVDGDGEFSVVTEVGHECDVCAESAASGCSQTIQFPRTQHLHLDIRKSISLRENELLQLQLGFIAPFAGGPVQTYNPKMFLWGSIKSLLQF